MEIVVRNARLEDVDAVFELIRRLAEHEGLSQYLTLTTESLRRILLEQPRRIDVLVAELENTIVG